MLSICIPSRQAQYLQKTIDDLLEKAEGEVEIIVSLDGYWPDPPIKQDPRVRVIHQGEVHNNLGMRAAINAGVAIAKGDYILKCDEHTLWDQGYDLKLIADCDDTTVVVPRRKRLDPENWEIIHDGRRDIDYMFVSYPYERPYDRQCGLYGAEWKRSERDGTLIDDLMTMQGSAYFMKKSYWDKLFPNGLDDVNYGPFNHEAQEISMTAWLSGGRVIVNKKTFYAHYHKGKKGKGYGFSNEQYRKFTAAKEKARRYAIDYWLVTQDYEHNFEWLINKFWPIPTWPDNWKQQIKIDEQKDWSKDPSQQPTEWLG